MSDTTAPFRGIPVSDPRWTRRLQSFSRGLLYTLLVFSPLARGGAHPWTHCVMALLTLAGVTAAWISRESDRERRRSPLAGPLLAFALLATASALLADYRPAAVDAFLLGGVYVGVYVWTVSVVRIRASHRRLVYVIVGTGAFVGMVGLLKQLDINPFPWWEYGIEQYEHVVTGTFGNRNHLAGHLGMVIPLLGGLLLWKERSAGALTPWICLAGIMLTAHALSLSRGGWIALSLALLLFITVLLARGTFRYKKWMIGGLAASAVVVPLLLVSTPVVERFATMTGQGPELTLASRLLHWRGTLDMIRANPFLGVGPGGFAEAYLMFEPPGQNFRLDYAHNDYLQFVAEYGLPAALPLIWAMIVIWRSGRRKMRHVSRLVRGVTLGALSGLFALAIHSVSDFNLHLPANAVLAVVLTALVTGPLPLENRAVKTKTSVSAAPRPGPAIRSRRNEGVRDMFDV